MMQTLLGIDLGTTGVKAALFAADDGRVLADAFVDYPLFHPQPGWAEQNPADWWQATTAAIRACLMTAAGLGVHASDVRGVGLSGQMHGVVLLDSENRVLRPCIIWADQRSDAQCRWITEKVGASKLIEYVSNPALTGFSAPKLLWIRDNEPQIYAQARLMLLPKDYIRFLLTGEQKANLIFGQEHEPRLRVYLRLVIAYPQQLWRGEAGQRRITDILDKLARADLLGDPAALCVAALVGPDDTGTQNAILAIQQHNTVHLAGEAHPAHIRSVHAEASRRHQARANGRRGRLPPVVGILLR